VGLIRTIQGLTKSYFQTDGEFWHLEDPIRTIQRLTKTCFQIDCEFCCWEDLIRTIQRPTKICFQIDCEFWRRVDLIRKSDCFLDFQILASCFLEIALVVPWQADLIQTCCARRPCRIWPGRAFETRQFEYFFFDPATEILAELDS
jgi:hypothetical protein